MIISTHFQYFPKFCFTKSHVLSAHLKTWWRDLQSNRVHLKSRNLITRTLSDIPSACATATRIVVQLWYCSCPLHRTKTWAWRDVHLSFVAVQSVEDYCGCSKGWTTLNWRTIVDAQRVGLHSICYLHHGSDWISLMSFINGRGHWKEL